MYKKLILVLIIFICGHLFAKEYSGNFIARDVKFKDKDIHVSSISMVYVEWSAGTLMGEPLFNSRGVVVTPYQSTYSTRYKNKTYYVPAEIIKKVDVVSVNIRAATSAFKSNFLDLDLGVMESVYVGDAGPLFPFLAQAHREGFISFNVPGSPNWNESFYKYKSIGVKEYLTEKEVKKIFADGIEIDGLFCKAEVEFNLSPVKNWIENSIKNKEGKAANKKAEKEELGKINNKIGGKTVNKHLSTQKKEDPFKKFDNMNSFASDENLEKIDGEIRSFIIKRCGMYYTDVRQGLTLSRGNVSEEKKKEVARKRRRDKLNMLPELQKKWIEKRESIKGECRSYIIKKYSFEVSTEKLEELLTDNFTSTEKFNGIYRY